MLRCVNLATAGVLLGLVLAGIMEVDAVPAKIQRPRGTTTPEPLEYEGSSLIEEEEMERHMTPQCVNTLQKLSDDLDDVKKNPGDPQKSLALLQKMMKDGHVSEVGGQGYRKMYNRGYGPRERHVFMGGYQNVQP